MSIQHQSMKRTHAFNYSQSHGKEDDFTTAALHRLLPCTSGKPPFVIQCPRADPHLQSMLPDTYSFNKYCDHLLPFLVCFCRASQPTSPRAKQRQKWKTTCKSILIVADIGKKHNRYNINFVWTIVVFSVFIVYNMDTAGHCTVCSRKNTGEEI